jgi:type I restriction enzyme S subunit
MIALQEIKSLAPWADSLPHGWRLCRLKSVASIRYGLGQPPAQLPSGVAMIRATDVDAGTIRTDNFLRVDPAELPPDRNPYLKAGEIIVVRSGAYTGDSAIVPSALEGAVAGYDMVATVTRASSHFVAYSLLSKHVLEDQIHLLTLRAAKPHLNAEELGSVVLAMPPTRHEQERIVAHLDASCAAIDVAVAAKRRQLETLDALRKSIVHRAVTNGLNPAAPHRASGVAWFGEIPRHWRCEHLKRFTKRIQAGMTPPTNTPEYYFDGTIPWFAPGSFNGDIDLREPRKLINELARSEGELRMFPSETVFLVGIGATIEKVGLVSTEASCNQQLIGIVCGHRMHSRFLAYQFKIYEDVIPGIATATTLPIFDQVKSGYLPTLQPPFEEQKSICAFLDTKLAESKKIVAGIESQIATLTAYRKSLIHECVTGQRRVTDEDLL